MKGRRLSGRLPYGVMWKKVSTHLETFVIGAIAGFAFAVFILVINMDMYGIRAHKEAATYLAGHKKLIQDLAPYYGDSGIKAILENNGVRFEERIQ